MLQAKAEYKADNGETDKIRHGIHGLKSCVKTFSLLHRLACGFPAAEAFIKVDEVGEAEFFEDFEGAHAATGVAAGTPNGSSRGLDLLPQGGLSPASGSGDEEAVPIAEHAGEMLLGGGVEFQTCDEVGFFLRGQLAEGLLHGRD
jgi:hypothetical protein